MDWPQISRWVRFVRAQGRCQVCGRPHGQRCAISAMAGGGIRPDRVGGTGAAGGPLPCLDRASACADYQGCPGCGASRSRSEPLRPTAPQPQGSVPALPPDPRPARAPSSTPAHAVPASGPGGSVPGPLPFLIVASRHVSVLLWGCAPPLTGLRKCRRSRGEQPDAAGGRYGPGPVARLPARPPTVASGSR